jgi:2-oxoglutarate ferredoxin oxidoreductase subunit beta
MFDYTSYLREARMPHIWCAGCGNGIIVKSLLRAVEKTGWSKDDIVMVSGIGCSSRTPG